LPSLREAALEPPQNALASAYAPGVVLPPLLLGVFLRALQMTVIAPSLVNIAGSLSATIAQVGWIVAIYATGSLVAQPIAGRLSDVRGRRAVFIGALALFIAGSVVCALSGSLAVLIVGRTVQSLGAGALQPAAVALIGQRVPVDRQSGALYLTYGMFALAGALGAILGGVLIDAGRALHLAYPWHLIFWLNIPLGLGALALALRLEPDAGTRQPVALDAGAIALVPAIAVCLMLAANEVSPLAWIWLAGAGALVLALIGWERIARQPFFEPALFLGRGPLALYAIALTTAVPIFSVTMYSATYYMLRFNASAAQAGVALLALAIPLGIGQAVGGRLARRTDLRVLLAAGIALLAAGEGVLAAAHSQVWVLAGFAVVGLGVGLASAPPNALLLRLVEQRRSGAATGLLTMLSSTGAITAPAAVSALLLQSGLPSIDSFRLEFALACVLAALCIPLVALVPRAATG
jgi:MFS family permease